MPYEEDRLIVNVHTSDYRGDHAADVVRSFTISVNDDISSLIAEIQEIGGKGVFTVTIPHQESLKPKQEGF